MVILDSQLGLGQQPTLVRSKLGLRAEGIGKSFNKRRVVRNVSIKLDRGEAVGLLGPNGAGKTTTFYMLAGLIPADEGSVFINGQDVTTLPIFQRARLGVGYLPQESSIFRGFWKRNLLLLSIMLRSIEPVSPLCLSMGSFFSNCSMLV